jgi:hypothetical protein
VAVKTFACFTLALLAACGGTVSGADGGSDGAVDESRPDSGFTNCSGNNLHLCGSLCGQACSKQNCFSTNDQSLKPPPDPNQLGLCAEKTLLGGGDCETTQGKDGAVCVLMSERWLQKTPLDTFALMSWADPGYAIMYALNGRLDLARYGDRSVYTNQPLPEPATCPAITGLPLCGGACGPCAKGYACLGRSPLHPYSLCVNEWGQTNMSDACERNVLPSCDSPFGDRRCFTFKVDDASQPIADRYSYCVDRSICDAAALSYPGGAFCTGGK